MKDIEREVETQAEGGAGSLAGGLMQDSIPVSQDHTWGQKQTLNH